MIDTRYGDMWHLSRPSSSRTPMPRENRAAQFAPFAALHGHEEAIGETARLTDRKIELDDAQKEEINRLLYRAAADRTLSITLTCFEADPFKDGGRYVTVSGQIKRIDEITGRVIFQDGTAVVITHIAGAAISPNSSA